MTTVSPGRDAGPEVAVLQVDDIVVKYGHGLRLGKRDGGPAAVDHVSFSVRAGEILGIVGESGSGKTSVARAAVGLVPIASGSIKVDGVERATKGRAGARRNSANVQMVFQDPGASLDPRQSIGSGFRELRRIHRQRSEWITDEDLLGQVGLSPRVLRLGPHQLSGGEAQRVVLARALLLRPKLIVADEPTSALDVSVQAQILMLLLDLVEQQSLAMLFISHDLSVIRQVCHSVRVMNKGRVVESGLVDVVMTDPQDPYTRKLLDSVPGRHLT